MTKNEIKLFKRVLKENGAFGAFYRNYDPCYGLSFRRLEHYSTPDSYLENNIYVTWTIFLAFDCWRSPEGAEFWCSISDIWNKELKK